MTDNIDDSILKVQEYLLGLQDSICAEVESIDGTSFIEDKWQHDNGSGGGRTRVLESGNVIEKGGVNFSHVKGDALPPSASLKRPELAGRAFQAMGVSLVLHPQNPFAPTTHMNVRFFVAQRDDEDPIWWFGGGFDLTPFYGFSEDAQHWHATAKRACDPFGETVHREYKDWCDQYFKLPHRNEQRGIGGLFFDDLSEPDFEYSFQLMKSVGDHFLPAYVPILKKRRDTPFLDSHREWQLVRRGRYVEFNLVHDRGTLFGLQSGGRTESILMSMPPMVSWRYRHDPVIGSPEQELVDHYLIPKNWLAQEQ